MPRFLFVVRFKERKNGPNSGFGDTKSFRTTAKSSSAAAKKYHGKGQIVSARKKKRV